MRNTLLFFALLSICLSSDISSDDYFLAPLPLNISDPDHIGAIFTIGSSMGVGWHTDRDSVDIYLYYDDDHYDYIIRIASNPFSASDANYRDRRYCC